MQSDTGAIYLSNKPTSKGWVYLKYMRCLKLASDAWINFTHRYET